MSLEENKELVRRFMYNAWNRKDICAVDELLAPSFCRHVATDPYMLNRAAQRARIFSVHHAFTALQLTIEDLIGEEDRVVFRGLLRGTHTGRFLTVEPTGRQIMMMVLGIMRVEDGLIAEQWGGVNELDLLQLIDGRPTDGTI